VSKSKRERNFRKEEAKFTDGAKKQYKPQKDEKRIKNLFRSSNIEQLLEVENYK